MAMICGYCNEEGNLLCAACKNVYYCKKEHQLLDWKKGHRAKCKGFEIAEHESLGRYMRAIRLIKAGEIILREKPLIYGPKIISAPICLGCNRFLQPQDIPVNEPSSIATPSTSPGIRNRMRKPKVKTQRNYYKCSKCNWPLCNAECEKHPTHLAECQLMAEKNFHCNIDYNPQDEKRKESAYCAILPLRCLLQKRTSDDGFAKFYSLQDHLNERIGMPIYNVLKSNLITFFKTILTLEEFDETTILKTAAILDTNAFEIRTSDGSSKIRAIYADTSMINHDCVPNSYHSFDENMQIIVRAAIDIKKGDMISLSYVQPLHATLQRRIYLRHSKCFECSCQRCRDPSECGTFIGSLQCSRCKSGKLVVENPFDSASDWSCLKCEWQMNATNFQYIQKRLQFAIENIDRYAPYDFEAFLEKYCYYPKQNGTDDVIDSNILLHEQNTFVLQVKYALTQLYGNVSGFLYKEICETDLKRKISLCEELLKVVSVLEPGKSIFRGKLLVDLQEALFQQIEQRIQNGEISKLVAREKFKEQSILLDEANSIFEYDATMKPMLAKRTDDLNAKILQPTF